MDKVSKNRYFYNGCAILGNVGTGLFIYVLGYMYGKNKNKINIYLDKYGAGLLRIAGNIL